ncbi:MAG: hypothetical protein WC543_01650 [Candidatus Omnitrophota bacterium]
MFKTKKECQNCQIAQLCRDSAISWVFLVIGLVATISIRVVNLVLPFGIFWPKFFWYLGVGGFFLYFFYKFREDKKLRLKLEKYQIHYKLSLPQHLGDEEKEFLRVMLCRMRSNKDAINYFFIFSSSAIVLVLALYQDFIKRIIWP